MEKANAMAEEKGSIRKKKTSTSSSTATVDTSLTLPILIRLESLSVNEKSPTCWQTTRHRLRKTRGEFWSCHFVFYYTRFLEKDDAAFNDVIYV